MLRQFVGFALVSVFVAVMDPAYGAEAAITETDRLDRAPAGGSATQPTVEPATTTPWRAALIQEAVAAYQRAKPSTETMDADEARIFVPGRQHRPLDPDVVVLQPIIVTDRFDSKRLEAAMEREYARRQAGKLHWGTGQLYGRDFGKVRLGVFSVLFVPVGIGLSW